MKQSGQSKGFNDSTENMSHVRLMCPENMKQLACIYSIQAEQWAVQDFQGNSHNIKVKGQNNPTMHRSHVRLIMMP